MQWGKIDLEDAYRLGYENGRSNARVQYEMMMPELFEKAKQGATECLEAYNASIEIIEESPAAYDFYTDDITMINKLATAKDFGVRIVVSPKTKYFLMPTRSEIRNFIELAQAGGRDE